MDSKTEKLIEENKILRDSNNFLLVQRQNNFIRFSIAVVIAVLIGVWIGKTDTENKYENLEPIAKTIVEVGGDRYYCQEGE